MRKLSQKQLREEQLKKRDGSVSYSLKYLRFVDKPSLISLFTYPTNIDEYWLGIGNTLNSGIQGNEWPPFPPNTSEPIVMQNTNKQ